jgi:hypothetical protein
MTDVTDAILANCVFSCPTIFDTALARTQQFRNCVFYVEGQDSFTMNEPPIVIHGLCRPVVIADNMVKIGHDYFCKNSLGTMTREQMIAEHGKQIGTILCNILSTKCNGFLDFV